MNDIPKPIICIKLDNELDLILAYKRTMQIAEISGLSFAEQTKFATAVSEISRNALEYGGGGKMDIYINMDSPSSPCIKAVISDKGPGISNLKDILSVQVPKRSGRGIGLTNSRRLVDHFEVESNPNQGTTVKLSKKLPSNHPPINHLILSGWRKHFSMVPPISPYDELKRQNNLLLETLEDLKNKSSQVEEQLEEITMLNDELKENFDQIKKLSEESAQQNSLLAKRNEELDEFAYIISHDLKAPLKNLEGLVSIIENGKPEQRERVLPMLKGQLNRLDKLIHSITSYSIAGREKVKKNKVSISELITEVINSLQKPADVKITLEKHFPVLYTEEIYLAQIFTNLISNAIKYGNKVDPHIRIGYNSGKEGQFMLYVEDNGPGIPIEQREKIFKMFVMLNPDPEKHADSSGIGLAIVKKIIDEKGGKIWIEDNKTEGQGTRFVFNWPAELVE